MITSMLSKRRTVSVVVVAVTLLLVLAVPAARLMAQEERGSIPGYTLTSDSPGEMRSTLVRGTAS